MFLLIDQLIKNVS